MSAPVIRRATPADLEALATYIAEVNAKPEHQCLHTPAARSRAMREALRRDGGLEAGAQFIAVVATMGSTPGIIGALGCQFEASSPVGWLWGPWLPEASGWKTDAAALLDALVNTLPPSVRKLDAFLNIENRGCLRFLQQAGFGIRAPTHIYVAPAAAGMMAAAGPLLSPLSARHEVGFARLHRETFPARESTPAETLLARRDDENVIFAAADDLRLLGYVCVSVNVAPREGFIDYLAVRPAVRGRGIGQRLLQTALHWTFEVRRLPQAALCVSEWRDDARRLYESAGFRLSATGRGARLELSKKR